MNLKQGQIYGAELDLPWPKGAWLGKAKSQLEEAGFADVTVWISDGKVYARGVWPGKDQEATLPDRVLKVWFSK